VSAAFYCARRALRRRLPSLAVVTMLIAVVVAGSLACATAARRAGSVYDRARQDNLLSDTTLQVEDPALGDAIKGLDVVERSTTVIPLWMVPDGVDEYFPVLADRDGEWLRSIDRLPLASGSLPSIHDPDAIVLTDWTADQLGLAVGDEMSMVGLSQDDVMQATEEGFSPPFHGLRKTFRVAAIIRLPPGNDDPSASALSVVMPGFLERHGDEVPTLGALVPVRLAPSRTLSDLADAVDRLPGGEGVVPDEVGTGGEDAAQSALRTIALGLAALTAVAALAGLVVAGQAVARLVVGSDDDSRVLAALGIGTRGRAIAAGAPAAVAAVVGVLLGTAVVPFVAPVLVGGLARAFETDPGPVLDWAVLAPGVAFALVALVAVALTTATLQQRANRRSSAVGGHGLAATAARLGLSAPAVAGLAVASSRSGRRVPTRQALAASLVGVIGVVGVAVFGASLRHAVDDHRQYGWAWDANVAVGMEPTSAELDRRGVTNAAMVTYDLPLQVESRPVTALSLEPVRGAIAPVVVRGRLPALVNEVLVGEKTLDEIDRGIGDLVDIEGPGGRTEVRIVGTTPMPSAQEPLPLASGVVIDPRLLSELGLEGTGYQQLGVQVDGDPREAFADLATGADVRYPEPPAEVARLEEVRGHLVLLVAFLAAIASLAVAHALAITIRRRRRDLGVLRSLGFTRRQVRRAVLTPAAVLAVAAIGIGLPLGVMAGRLGWRALTESIGVPFVPVVPAGLLAAVIVGVAAVTAVAVIPSVIASGRVRPGVVLAAE
jgi:hypothetical protein